MWTIYCKLGKWSESGSTDGATTEGDKVLKVFRHSDPVGAHVLLYSGYQLIYVHQFWRMLGRLGQAEVDKFLHLDNTKIALHTLKQTILTYIHTYIYTYIHAYNPLLETGLFINLVSWTT